MLNRQKPEPRSKHDGKIDLHSMFYTIQGEGPFQGRPSLFVRLSGCNLQCPWCDTEYTQGRKLYNEQELAEKICHKLRDLPTRLIVLTGGEPLRQNVEQFLIELIVRGYDVQIETNGVFGISKAIREFQMDKRVTVVCSPKTRKVHETMRYADAWKYVLQDGEIAPSDGLPMKALGHKAVPFVARPMNSAPVFVNPMDAKDPLENKLNMQAASRSALAYGYLLGIQAHKYYDLE